MDINENALDDFYERWNKYQDRIIIVKYNDYRGEFPVDNSIDLSPINRFPCWHLKRDLYITGKCEAIRCKQDYRAEHSTGNVLNQGVLECFHNNENFYKNDYLNGPADYCKNCDEYYTYNF
jgi:spiro-SPASM protein